MLSFEILLDAFLFYVISLFLKCVYVLFIKFYLVVLDLFLVALYYN